MIVNRQHGWIFVLPPKTASTSLVEILTGPAFGGELHRSGIPGVVDQHWVYPPDGCDQYRVFLSVRHPVPRAASIYGHLKREDERYGCLLDQEWFARCLVSGRGLPAPGWAFNCCDYLRQNPRLRLSGFVRAERLAGDLERLGLHSGPFEVVHRNRGPGGGPILGGAAEDQLLEWGREDLVRFYPRDIT